ncbi:MAG: three-Cys-motif partner protein TcmP [Alphaproteobacteria bacterium]
MAKKEFDWDEGVTLDDHSKRKHKILREYFRKYLITRCTYPRDKFRLTIVDAFSGAGRYDDGSPGSPLILMEVLKDTFNVPIGDG